MSSGDHYHVDYHTVGASDVGTTVSAAAATDSGGSTGAVEHQSASVRDTRVVAVREGLESAVDAMKGNIRAITSRGENMETLLCKSESVGGLAQNFTSQSRAFERSQWFEQYRIVLVIGAVVLLLLGITFVLSRVVFYSATFGVCALGCVWMYRQLEIQNRLQNPPVPREIALTRV
eukprot:Lankesteria_metandrocarpae@DN8110_c0_g1_i1.p1